MVAMVTLLFGHAGILDSSLTDSHLHSRGPLVADVMPAETVAQVKSHSPQGPPDSVSRKESPAPPSIGPATAFPKPIEIEAPEKRLALASAPADTLTLRQVFGLDVKTIVIDPGHGGIDPGTSGKNGLQEKVIALDVAKRLKKRLDCRSGYSVILTRDADVTLSLKERIEFANSRHADLFISLHVNYVPAMPENIIETYYFGISENESVLALASLENADSMVGMNEFKKLGEKLGGALKFQESRGLASRIQQSLFSNISKSGEKVLDNGIKKAPFLVIMGTEMPGVLAELTCLSNPEEEEKLRRPEYREDISGYLETGILNYLNKGDYIYEARR